MGDATGERARRHVVVHGRVQGVYFRGSVEQVARRERVDGWVRNCSDGSVEGVFEGRLEAVEALVEWCRHGPRWARVDRLEVREEPPSGERGFRISR